MRALNHTMRLTTGTLLIMVLGCYVFASTATGSEGKNLTRINSSVHVESGEQLGDVSSINGSITVNRQASARDVETVNGRIELGDGTRVEHASTVNGRIRVGRGVEVGRSLETVNGDIDVGRDTHVAGHIHTVNGEIRLRATRVGDYVRTTNSDIEVLDGSVIEGDIIFRGKRSWLGNLFSFGNERRPDLTIDGNSEVRGTIHLYKEVDLRIHEDAVVGEIVHHY